MNRIDLEAKQVVKNTTKCADKVSRNTPKVKKRFWKSLITFYRASAIFDWCELVNCNTNHNCVLCLNSNKIKQVTRNK